jgi:DNA-binding winged helix-turn-helix (wHTH) protein
MSNAIRFGVYEFDAEAGILKRDGFPIRLQEQPARLLAALLERPGELVPREELRARIWPSDTFVQFDTSLNTAIRKVRYALREDANSAVYIETVPKRGYRFIAPVSVAAAAQIAAPDPPVSEPPAEPIAAARRPIARFVILALAFIGLASVIAWRLIPARLAVATRLSIPLPAGHSLATYFGNALSISADGQKFSFLTKDSSGGYGVWTRRLNQSESVAEKGYGEVAYFQLSPSGESAAFVSRNVLYLQAENRPRVELHRFPIAGPVSVVWGDDGFLYYSAPAESDSELAPGALWRIRPDGSRREILARNSDPRSKPEWILPMQWLGQNRLLISSFHDGNRNVQIFHIAERRRSQLYYPGSGGFITPQRLLLFHEFPRLRAMPLSRDLSSTDGTPFDLLSTVALASWSGGNIAISPSGNAVYAHQPRQVGDRRLVWVDLQGEQTPLSIAPGPFEVCDLSSDGNHLLLRRNDGTNDVWSLWAVPLEGGGWLQVASGLNGRPMALWLPGDKEVAFTGPGLELQRRSVFPLLPPTTLLTRGNLRLQPQFVDRREGYLYFTDGFHPGKGISLHRISLKPGAAPATPEAVLDSQGMPSRSPDGKWFLTGFGLDSFSARAYPFAANGSSVLRHEDGGAAIWSKDGSSVYYRRQDRVMTARFVTTPRPALVEHRELFRGDFQTEDKWSRQYLLHPDGKRMLFSVRDSAAEEILQLNVILNWYAELDKLAR